MIQPKLDCQECKGGGLNQEGKRCVCVARQEYALRIKQAVGKHGKLFDRIQIPVPRIAYQSPLVLNKRARSESLVIRGEWPAVLSHVCAAVVVESVRDLTVFSNEYRVRVASDLKIREAYFASGGQAHLQTVEDVDLLIIRVGLAAPHKANQLALYEVLAMADDQLLPVWLVEPPSRPFREKHPSWSEDIGAMIEAWPKVSLVAQEDDPKGLSLADAIAQANEVE